MGERFQEEISVELLGYYHAQVPIKTFSCPQIYNKKNKKTMDF